MNCVYKALKLLTLGAPNKKQPPLRRSFHRRRRPQTQKQIFLTFPVRAMAKLVRTCTWCAAWFSIDALTPNEIHLRSAPNDPRFDLCKLQPRCFSNALLKFASRVEFASQKTKVDKIRTVVAGRGMR